MRGTGVAGILSEMPLLLGELKLYQLRPERLKHSTEMAQIAGMIKEEIGGRARYCWPPFGDVGKAVSHKIEGAPRDLVSWYGRENCSRNQRNT